MRNIVVGSWTTLAVLVAGVSATLADADGWTASGAAEVVRDARGVLHARAERPDVGWTWEAPASLLGDRSDVLDGRLEFTLRDDGRGRAAKGPAATLEGGGRELGFFGRAVRRDRDGRLRVVAPLDGRRGWRDLVTARRATRGDLREALADLERLSLRGNVHRGATSGALLSAELLAPDRGGASPKAAVHAPAPQIVLSMHSRDFGKVLLGRTATQRFIVGNAGDADLQIVEVVVSGEEFRVDVPNPGPDGIRRLAPEEAMYVDVEYRPWKAGATSGWILFRSDSRPGAVTRLTLKGSCHAALSGGAWADAGTVEVGKDEVTSVTVVNRADVPIDIGIDFEGSQGDAGQFDLAEGRYSRDAIPPGGSAEFPVRYKPTAPGRHKLALLFHVNAAGAEIVHQYSVTGVRGRAVPATPELLIDPAALEFGEGAVGEVLQLALTIENAGATPLDLTFPATLPAPFRWAGAPPDAVVPPLEGVTALVEFVPTKPGKTAKTLRFVADDLGHRKKFVVPLRAESVATRLAVDPAAVDFGEVALGARAQRTITLSNPGPGTIRVVVPTPKGSAAEWTLVSGGPTTIDLAAGAQHVVTVSFGPSRVGARKSRISFGVDIPGKDPVVTAALGGAGTESSAPGPVSLVGTWRLDPPVAGHSDIEMVQDPDGMYWGTWTETRGTTVYAHKINGIFRDGRLAGAYTMQIVGAGGGSVGTLLMPYAPAADGAPARLSGQWTLTGFNAFTRAMVQVR